MTDTRTTILLLEDEPLILMDLEFAAEDRGYRPLSATNIAEALKHLASESPVVAILDVSLQRNATCEPVAQELNRLGIPFILHSGDLDRSNETVRKLDATLVAKPAPSDEVVDVALKLSLS